MPNTENKNTEYEKQKEIKARLKASIESIDNDLQLLNCDHNSIIDMRITLLELGTIIGFASSISLVNTVYSKTETASNG